MASTVDRHRMHRLAGFGLLGFAVLGVLAVLMHPLVPGQPAAGANVVAESGTWMVSHVLLLLAGLAAIVGFGALAMRIPPGRDRSLATGGAAVAALGLLMIGVATVVEMTSVQGAAEAGRVAAFNTAHQGALVMSIVGVLLVAAGAILVSLRGRHGYAPGHMAGTLGIVAAPIAAMLGLAGLATADPGRTMMTLGSMILLQVWAIVAGAALLGWIGGREVRRAERRPAA